MNKIFKDKKWRDGIDFDTILRGHTPGCSEPQSEICTGNAESSLLKAGLDLDFVQG